MHLGFEFSVKDLYSSSKLQQLHAIFKQHLQTTDPQLHTQCYGQTAQDSQPFMLPLAMAVEAFVIQLFNLSSVVEDTYQQHHRFRLASHFKRNFIQRDALHTHSSAVEIDANNIIAQLSQLLGQTVNPSNEVEFAQLGLAALSKENADVIELFRQYAAWAYYTPQGQQHHQQGFLFKKPQSIDPLNRIPVSQQSDGALLAPQTTPRVGFNLTDHGISSSHAVDEAFYCLKCHERNKDTCRTGFKLPNNETKQDALGQPLSGCPLNQKISEMNVLYEHGQIIAALAVITLDNPMVAATGHRICYDCSRSCIFQKQDPVDIPSIETRILKDVLALPYGFEIYSLLTRWNPLNVQQPYPAAPSGYSVLVVGQGPSGFGLAHLLMQQGHAVTAIDGLKIEPLPRHLKDPSIPVENFQEYTENLSTRHAVGFGGVAEYGITSRWNKNFLLAVRLLLERRNLYTLLDGVRLGSSITLESAFHQHQFDHVALCLGAGSPTVLNLPGVTSPGIRLASDFLMALNLGDAPKPNTKTTLRVQLPVAVVGAGLTAIDAATEALAYYPIQVMRFYTQYHQLVQQQGEDAAHKILNINPQLAAEFLNHGEQLLAETKAAHKEGRKPNYLPYLNKWGGVTIYYRKALNQAPAYKLNPHELNNALKEGVRFIQHATPISLHTNDTGLSSVAFNINNANQTVAVKTLLIAAGTKPNTVLADEDKDLQLDGVFFKPIQEGSFFVRALKDGRYVSYLGDLHPNYSGSVVKALASAKYAAPVIHKALQASQPAQPKQFNKKQFISTIQSISNQPESMEFSVYSPQAANAYKPGQFYKLQPYGARFTEPVPLAPTQVCKSSGTLHFSIQKVGATTHALGQHLRAGQKVYLMGPTGTQLHIPQQTKLLFVCESAVALQRAQAIMNFFPGASYIVQPNVQNIQIAELNAAEAIMVMAGIEYLQQFKHTHLNTINVQVYSFVYSHLQCMMKQVCAQCVYTVKSNGKETVQFGCAKHVELMNKIEYADIKKRNKNDSLEEALLSAISGHIV